MTANLMSYTLAAALNRSHRQRCGLLEYRAVLVIAACIALVAVGAFLVVRWGGLHPRETSQATAFWWIGYLGVALAAGLTAGVLAAGAGGRLAMRLLALTSPQAEGSFTEAAEVVGEITAGGTVGFIVFAGLPAGFVSAVLYALVRPVLPPGRAGGVILGLLLLLFAGTTIDPLRPDNLDFVLLGPDWLAVLAFTALAVFQGLVVTAVGARLDQQVSLPRRPRVVAQAVIAVLTVVALPGFVADLGVIL
jgi:hypothetical protein